MAVRIVKTYAWSTATNISSSGEGDAEREGADAEKADQLTVGEHGEEEEVRRGEAEHEQHVPGDHVHQKSEGQRDRAEDERREELERDQQDVQRPRHAGDDERVLEEAEAMLAEAGVDEHDVCHDGEDERQADDGRARRSGDPG